LGEIPFSAFEIWCSQVFRVIACCDFNFWPNQYVPGADTYIT